MTTITVNADDLIALLSAANKSSDKDNLKVINRREIDAFSRVWDATYKQMGCTPEHLYMTIKDVGNSAHA